MLALKKEYTVLEKRGKVVHSPRRPWEPLTPRRSVKEVVFYREGISVRHDSAKSGLGSLGFFWFPSVKVPLRLDCLFRS